MFMSGAPGHKLQHGETGPGCRGKYGPASAEAAVRTAAAQKAILRELREGRPTKSVGREEHIGTAQSAISNTIHEVTEAIITVSARRKLVGFSLTQATKDDAKTAFPRRGDIRGVLQCVDGTLVAIRKPEGLNLPDTASLMSRKECYALNVMLGTSLSCHCSATGDSAYPLEPWLLIPVPDNPAWTWATERWTSMTGTFYQLRIQTSQRSRG
ncbi:hypothetical protein MTO96_045247 [Rhipicephalus appendiculatus]